MRGLTAGDFTVTVAGQPRRVVNAEFVDSLAETSRSNLRRSSLESMISTNEGASIGRMFVFVVDQGTLEAGQRAPRRSGRVPLPRHALVRRSVGADAAALRPERHLHVGARQGPRGARPGDWPGRPRQRVRVRQPDGGARNLQPQPDRPSHRRAARVRQRRGGLGRIRRVQRRFRRPAAASRRRRAAAGTQGGQGSGGGGTGGAAAPAAPAAPRGVVGWLGHGTTVERRRIRQQLHP